MTNPTTPNKAKEEADALKAKADAEKALADARLAEVENQAKIALASQRAAAELMELEAKGKKAEQDARSAKIAADKAAQEAAGATPLEKLAEKLPTAPENAASVTVGKDAGTIEANILALRAAKVLGTEIAKSVADLASGGFVLWTSDEPPSFSRAETYEASVLRLENLFRDAFEAYEEVANQQVSQVANVTVFGMPGITSGLASAVGSAATIAEKAASFLQITHSYAPLETTGTDVDLLARATAASLRQFGAKTFDPRYASTKTAFETMREKVNALAKSDELAGSYLIHCDTEIQKLNQVIVATQAAGAAKVDEGADSPKKPVEERAKWLKAKTMIEAAQSDFDGLISTLGTKNEGQALASSIAREMALRTLVSEPNRYFLQLKVHASGGTSESRSSFWSFLPFFQPFRVSGGVVASFLVFGPATGEILLADSLEAHSGFHGIKTLRRSAGHREAMIARRRQLEEKNFLEWPSQPTV